MPPTRTQDVNNTFIARLEEDEQVFHQHAESRYIQLVLQVVQVELFEQLIMRCIKQIRVERTLHSTSESIIFWTILVSRNNPFSTVMTRSLRPGLR